MEFSSESLRYLDVFGSDCHLVLACSLSPSLPVTGAPFDTHLFQLSCSSQDANASRADHVGLGVRETQRVARDFLSDGDSFFVGNGHSGRNRFK